MTDKGLELVKHFEGCKLKAYPDPGTGGHPWTAGFGSTGADIGPDTVWSQYDADTRLISDLAKFENGVRKLLQVHLNDDQVSALTSFAYNLGLHALSTSTLMSLVNSGDFTGVLKEFPKWIHSNGHVMEGLVARRVAEACLFNSNYSGLGAIIDCRT